ncbi:hypothetical protein JQN58_18325 [Aneurinibacillus sp. BA2021]|nr:hypothetical protein [Aneurinibacillus sp. BA2021]
MRRIHWRRWHEGFIRNCFKMKEKYTIKHFGFVFERYINQ